MGILPDCRQSSSMICFYPKGMNGKNGKLEVLLAEDDSNDIILLECAIRKNNVPGRFHIVRDGFEAIAYLKGEGKFEDRLAHPFPDLIVLDIKMPQITGFEVLKWLRAHPDCATIPAVMLSGSELDSDIEEAFRLGANSYFRKPSSIDSLTGLLRAVVHYWWLSERPRKRRSCK